MIRLKDLLVEAVTEPAMTKAEADKLAERLRREINAPHATAQVSTLGGAHRPSVLLSVSLDPKNEWPYHIYQNSRYSQFHIMYDGTIEQFSRTHKITTKFRKARFKKPDEVVSKINTYLDKIR
jgi:hypothetical protein